MPRFHPLPRRFPRSARGKRQKRGFAFFSSCIEKADNGTSRALSATCALRSRMSVYAPSRLSCKGTICTVLHGFGDRQVIRANLAKEMLRFARFGETTQCSPRGGSASCFLSAARRNKAMCVRGALRLPRHVPALVAPLSQKSRFAAIFGRPCTLLRLSANMRAAFTLSQEPYVYGNWSALRQKCDFATRK